MDLEMLQISAIKWLLLLLLCIWGKHHEIQWLNAAGNDNIVINNRAAKLYCQATYTVFSNILLLCSKMQTETALLTKLVNCSIARAQSASI